MRRVSNHSIVVASLTPTGEEATEYTPSPLDTPVPFTYSPQVVHKAVSPERSGGEANALKSSNPLEVGEKGHGKKNY